MASADLMLHKGARQVTVEELAQIPCPPAEGFWRPVPHHDVLKYATDALSAAGYSVQKLQLGVARDDKRFWGTMVLENNVVAGVNLAVAVASSLDKSISLRWAFGHRVWVCDNGAWSAEKTISRKHTTHAVERYREAICRCVGELEQYQQAESERIKRMMYRQLTDAEGESYLLRAYQDLGILSPRSLPVALKEWRNPSFEYEGEEKSAWQLFNAVTTALNKRAQTNPQAHADATIRLGGLLEIENALPAHQVRPEEAHETAA